MKARLLCTITCSLLLSTVVRPQAPAGPAVAKPADTSPHTVQFVTVEEGVKLEVLDWGGTGRPLVFLAGLGFDAHGFDTIAPKLVPKYHVYAISRRGFGASSAPPPLNGNYSADRLGDDVLAVIDALKLQRPVLAGHSIAGEELSSIGSRHPEKVAALIYLDAGYPYACYDPTHGDIILDALELKKKLDLFVSAAVPDMNQFFSDLQTTLPRFENDVSETRKKLALWPPRPPHSGTPPPIYVAISAGEQKYTEIHAPVLAFFAVPHDLSQMFPNDPAARQAAADYDLLTTGAQADAFAKCAAGAHIVRLPNANHWVFGSNEAEVLREMDAFLANLP